MFEPIRNCRLPESWTTLRVYRNGGKCIRGYMRASTHTSRSVPRSHVIGAEEFTGSESGWILAF